MKFVNATKFDRKSGGPDSPKCKCGGMCKSLRRECGDSRNRLPYFKSKMNFPLGAFSPGLKSPVIEDNALSRV